MGPESTHPPLPLVKKLPLEQGDQHELGHQDHDQERDVQAGHGWDDPAHRPQHRLGGSVEEELDLGQGRPRLNAKPAQESQWEHDQVDIQPDQQYDDSEEGH
jgi:hypothetical protein